MWRTWEIRLALSFTFIPEARRGKKLSMSWKVNESAVSYSRLILFIIVDKKDSIKMEDT